MARTSVRPAQKRFFQLLAPVIIRGGILGGVFTPIEASAVVASSVSGVLVEIIARAILPFMAVEVFVIFLIAYVPAISRR